MSDLFSVKVRDTKVFYLASPYSHPSAEIRQERYEAVDAAGAFLTGLGFNLIEPIASCHPKSLKYNLPSGYAFWQQRDRLMIERCDGVIVLTIPGWEESAGVTDEIQYAESIGLPIYYLKEITVCRT